MQKSFERQRLLNKIMSKNGPFPYVLILDNLKVDFNSGKIIRSAEAFGAHAVDAFVLIYEFVRSRGFNPPAACL